ncbi:uncharacterized protein LOC127471020 isoform X24 [Manacus candei]|uniref:uncharacterized protein LOC127471020 isoform X24 n=1 Tax=Manacus candei TaxID=415023 RepID=UPI0022274697|nr:uncharacterized protein LOC127471020 isoform X24 [Manacus candei]
MEKKTKGLEHVILDPPGQAEVTASGAILTEALAASFPSVAVGVPDASGRTNPVAFMSNVLCCVPAGEDFLPLWVSPSAWQEQSGLPGRYSPGQRQEPSYLRPRLPLSLRSPWVCRTPLAGLTLWLLCPTCCAACLQGKTFWLPLSLRSPWVCRTPLAGLTLWLLCPTCCAACLQNCHERKYFRGASLQISPEYARRFQPGGKELWKKSSLKVASGDHQVFQPRRTRREMGESGSNS